MVFIYNIFIRLYIAAVNIASLFNTKAQLWVSGRKDIFKKLHTAIDGNNNIIWIHCASLGEFEQGRPVIEKMKADYPDKKILLTFFSPSGYEIRKNYAGADWVFYLPADIKTNARKFIETVNPMLVIFVKYEYWYNYLNQLAKKQIPVILISALFRENAIFFKWYGNLHRRMLQFFSHIFVQNKESFERVKKFVANEKITVAGDTRFDRVVEIANSFKPIPMIEKFANGKKIIVAGSTWQDDENNLKALIDNFGSEISLIIAPHEINATHINFLSRLFLKSLLFSDIENNHNPGNGNVLIIDNIGMLSSLYYYSAISYVGGGFNKSGIHNILEAAVYKKPVIFGPNYQKFNEAVELIINKGAFSYNSDTELITTIEKLIENNNNLENSGKIAGKYVIQNTGATEKIMEWIRQTFS